ncbi:hypothetical protein [Hymenobacter psychrophilus]|uniref:Uncharacterized protein n=1 Tax=Hymenobacter psychrophilus TaxID=651662 RepID=A0A1H3D0P9_9BACT|nr:hypothetical protein [Hymenobacter psychrophilus]SDX60043.1 hypothetical protein SAMN04488069_102184 [Hymenobacter psychrophilus]
MYKLAIIFAGLLLSVAVGPKAWGQSLPLGADTVAAPVTLPSLSTLRYGHSDTLRAVQHLFMQRSKATRGWLQAGTGILLDGAVKKVVVKASKRKKQPEYVQDHYEDLDQQANQDIVFGALMTGYGIFRLSRFGPRQYQRVVAAYQQGQPLPPYLNRKLKTKYFRLLPLGSRQERAQAVAQ